MNIRVETIKQEIRQQVAVRGPGKTICPSEVARVLGETEPEWRSLMTAVRDAAIELAKAGEILILQKGEVVEPPFRGPIRLGWK